MAKVMFKTNQSQDASPLPNDLEQPKTKIPLTEMKVVSTFKKIHDRWQPITFQELCDAKLGMLLDDTMRIMIACEYEKEKIFFTTTKEDRDATKKKYPDAVVVSIPQFIKLWTGQSEDNILKVIPSILMSLSVLENSKVVSLKNV